MNESPVKNIKTREVKRDIKVLDKAAEAAKSMKQAEESRRTLAEAEKQTAETVVEETQGGPLPHRRNNTAPKVEQATFRQREYGVQQHEARVRRLRKAKVTVTEVEAGRTAQTTAIYAIKVGRTTLDMLNVSKELDMDVSIIPKDNPSYVDEAEPEEGNTGRRDLDVFDVLLAGVESDD